jgi:hypothetical protein
MYGSPAQARAAGVYDSKMQQQMPAAPYDGSGQFMPIAQPSIGDFEQRQFLPSRQLEPEINQNGMPMPTAPFSSGGGAKVGGLNGALQPRSMAVDQPFSQPLRSFGGFNNLPSAGAMNQFPTPAAAPMFQYGQGSMMDPTLMAQQAILARPMRPSFTGQQLMSREVPLGIQGNSGLAYPSMGNSGLLNAPSYTSRYAGTDSGGGSSYGGASVPSFTGFDTYGSYNSLTNGLVGALMGNLSSPSYGITVDNMGTYADQPDFGYGSGMTGVGNPGESDFGGYTSSDSGIGNPGESVGGYTSSDTGVGNPGESYGGPTSAESGVGNPGESAGDSGGGGGKIVCTAMNQQYGFGSFRNAIWLKYAENNLTKAHEAGYHAIFLPLVDFAFKQGDGKLNMLTRKFLENCARHRSLDLRAEMRGTKRDTIGMIYRSVLEPLCYAVGKFKGY